MATPLKLNASDAGDLKEMTTTEEQYLAYQGGLQLAAMAVGGVGALDNNSGGTTVGTYSNTFYNQAIGTSPGSALSIGTTNTSLYQNTGETADYTNGNFHRPVHQDAGTNVREFDDTDMNTITARLSTYLFTNNLPGAYYLASSAPSGDWDTHISNIFVDTQASDGSTINYSIFQRQTYSAPTAVRPIKLEGTDGTLKEMSDAEIKETFGQWMKTRMSVVGAIGNYQLRTSGQGAPSDAGVWAARGTATDTRKATSDVAYSATYSADYSGAYTTDFVADYTGDFIGNFTGNYVGNYTGDYVGNYTGTSSIRPANRTNHRPYPHSPSLVYSYTGFYAITYYGTADYTGTYSAEYSADYSADYTSNFTNVFTGNYTGNFTGTYTGNYTGDYLSETIGNSNSTIETYTLYVRVS